MHGADPARFPGGSSGPWIVKVRYSGATGKHSAQPFRVDDVVIINLGLPPESDPPAPELAPDGMEATAFLTEEEMPARGLDVDFEVFRIAQDGDSWNVVSD